jgi:hypothetical protein
MKLDGSPEVRPPAGPVDIVVDVEEQKTTTAADALDSGLVEPREASVNGEGRLKSTPLLDTSRAFDAQPSRQIQNRWWCWQQRLCPEAGV